MVVIRYFGSLHPPVLEKSRAEKLAHHPTLFRVHGAYYGASWQIFCQALKLVGEISQSRSPFVAFWFLNALHITTTITTTSKNVPGTSGGVCVILVHNTGRFVQITTAFLYYEYYCYCLLHSVLSWSVSGQRGKRGLT